MTRLKPLRPTGLDLADKPDEAHRAEANESNEAKANEANEAIVINKAIGAKETN